MGSETLRIAFYGKGGIGKSTLACNLSAAFALSGRQVLHIGCDPKADSTRCLTRSRIPTVLQQLNSRDDALIRSDLLFPGLLGISCVEAGGPQAGVGCAGLGITAMEEELRRQGIFDEPWDVIVYDVLGDIVCGGFSVPMRERFVDRVYLVTSSEFMSLYAANNIMKGLAHYSSGSSPLLGGLLHNHCFCGEDEVIAAKFACRTNTRVLGTIWEDRVIRRADFHREPVLITAPDSPSARVFTALAGRILEEQERTVPCAMDDEALEDFCRQVFEREEFI